MHSQDFKNHSSPMIGENRQIVTDEHVEFREITG
jgi:hypothetical protein